MAKHASWLNCDLRIRPSGLEADEAWAIADARRGESRMVAFANIVPDLPESRRPAAVREAMVEYWKSGGDLAIRIAVACAPWLDLDDAAHVLVAEIGGTWASPGSLFTNYGSLSELGPLLLRLGGPAAVLGVAREVIAVAKWLP